MGRDLEEGFGGWAIHYRNRLPRHVVSRLVDGSGCRPDHAPPAPFGVGTGWDFMTPVCRIIWTGECLSVQCCTIRKRRARHEMVECSGFHRSVRGCAGLPRSRAIPVLACHEQGARGDETPRSSALLVTCGGFVPSESYLVSSPHESPLFLSGIHCRRPPLQLPYHRTRNPSSRLLRPASCSRSN